MAEEKKEIRHIFHDPEKDGMKRKEMDKELLNIIKLNKKQ